MPSVEPSSRRSADLLLTAGVLAALIAALLPLMRVVRPTGWLLGTLVIVAMVLATGYIARRFRLPALAVSLIEIVVWVAFVTVVFLRDSAFLLVIPTVETFRELPDILAAAGEEIALGVAPLAPSAPLAMLIVGATGLLAVVIDHVVLTARMPLLAGVGLIAISLIPAIAVPAEIDVVAFVLLAAAMLFLMRIDTRTREEAGSAEATRATGVSATGSTGTGVSATAIGIGAIAVVVALVATPLLPQPTIRPGSGDLGPGPGIDATLQLGDDLRRPREVEVLQMRSDAPTPPYLRATTLTEFTGAVWEPDSGRSYPLDSAEALAALPVDPEIQVAEYSTTVEIRNLNSSWLPVSYPATAIDGLDGVWGAFPYNRTVEARQGGTQGQDYEVISRVPRPTLEQIRARSAGGEGVRADTLGLPADLPAIVGELAAEVTAGAASDYDALLALQSWFRGTDFRYSLEAPVEEGFDGSGAEAVARFLEVREGYCVHYASAFALMARTLDMPSRIVVGYLPGTSTGDAVDFQTVYSVMSGQLHSWPEVYFEGVGWIPFEPTNGLGQPTRFSPEASAPGETADGADAAPEASAPADVPDAVDPDTGEPLTPDAGTAAPDEGVDALPAVTVILAVLVVLAIPLLVRDVRRRQQLSAARAGDAAAAWAVVQDTAIDLGIPSPISESPRALGARLIAEAGAPAEAMGVLIRAIERASYAPGGRHGFGQGEATAAAAQEVRADLLAAAQPARRLLALVVPRSLIIRPGSLYAGAGRGASRPAG
ncbi:transglutaminase-like putative cysteine protease [Microbacterium sp. AK009]|uniref:transglutaminaseTgpA domain-containing protein n=1 Tax=Microbacterium sp. AK009 TaxID=2723068 RepID=UPI0017CA1D3B|nr:transglutaminaseTgpA domain-containing protein [Microbacterium sp. AK009]NYF17618.1 transglutaminase-like putative cysteine protease [Microbacterium sp. AK009]